MTEQEFRAMLQGVTKSYPAFVNGVTALAKGHGIVDEVIHFIEENPDATAGKVASYSSKLAGVG